MTSDLTSIRKLKANSIAGTNVVNRLIDRSNSANCQREGVSGFGQRAFPITLGIIVANGPNGEDDFSDENYWVQTAFIANGTSSANLPTDDLLIVKSSSSDQSSFQIIAVCNLAERAAKTHSLATDGSVAVLVTFSQDDIGSPSLPRYAMTHGGAGGGSVPVGEFVYSQFMVVAQNQDGFRMDRYSPLIPNL